MKNAKKTEKLWCILNTLYFGIGLGFSVYAVATVQDTLEALKEQGGVGAAFGVLGVAVVMALFYIALFVCAILFAVSVIYWILVAKRKNVRKGAGPILFGIIKIIACAVFIAIAAEGSWGMLAAVVVTLASLAMDIICLIVLAKRKKQEEPEPTTENSSEN